MVSTCSKQTGLKAKWPLFLLVVCQLFAACQFQPSGWFNSENVPLVNQAATEIETENLAALIAADPAKADLAELFARFNPDQPIEQPARQMWQAGDVNRFFYTEQANETIVETNAQAIYVSQKLIMWVEQGINVDEQSINTAAQTLENEIFPRTRRLFGSEPSPGIDQNEAIHILHIGDMGGATIGYFSGKDEYPRQVARNSNEREMFYINLNFVEIGEQDYFDVVSHEFEHMIMWNIDRNEHTWINEGLAELSTMVNGYGGSDFLPTFLRDTDTSLTGFDYEGGDYAAAWLMMAWLQEKYGDQFISDLVAQPENSVKGIDGLLRSYDPSVNFEQIYAEWMVALYGANHNLKLSSGYKFESVASILSRAHRIEPVSSRTGQRIQTTVGQYGSDYWQIPADQPYSITITPTQQVALFSGDPAGGQWYWTSIPADFSDMHLTRQVDLSQVNQATLNFKAFYDIEEGYDYAYVAVSADDGKSWQPLETSVSTQTDPHRKNFGFGITGISGELESPQWVNVTADLTPFTGDGYNDLLLRFEQITDDAVQHEGLAIDELSIPEIGWIDGAENGEEDWIAEGFVRHTNRLPQTFVTQTMWVQKDGTVEVRAHRLTENSTYRIDVDPSDSLDHIILAIAGTTPITKQAAGYHLFVAPSQN